MDANCTYQDLQYANLKHIPKTEGVSFRNKRKQDLVDLGESTKAQNDSKKSRRASNQETHGAEENFTTSMLRHLNRLE